MATTKQIVVVDNGWVFLGDHEWIDGGKTLFLKAPLNIRAWGTDRGLGQLAIEGPQSETVLDAFTDLYIPQNKVCYTMDVIHAGPWAPKTSS